MASKHKRAATPKPVPGYTARHDKARTYKVAKGVTLPEGSKWLDEKKRIVSKRTFQKAQAAKEFGKAVSNERAADLRATKRKQLHIYNSPENIAAWKQHLYNGLVKDYKKQEQKRILKETGKKIPLSKIYVRGDNESAKRFRKLLKDLKSKDRSNDGPFAKALEGLGRRDPEAKHPPGQSPTTEFD